MGDESSEERTVSAPGPYREASPVQLIDEKRVVFLRDEFYRDGKNRARLYPIILDVQHLEFFEAVVAGVITAEHASALLLLRRDALRSTYPWYVRTALWIWGRK